MSLLSSGRVGESPHRQLSSKGFLGTGLGQYFMPTFVCVDPRSGEVYIADSLNHRVVCCGADLTPSHVVGARGDGDDQVLCPYGLAIDAERRELYVADAGNHRVQVFALAEAVAGRDCRARSVRRFGVLEAPYGVALDPREGGLVYVADANKHCVTAFTREGVWAVTFGSMGSALGELMYPRGMVFLAEYDRLVVCDSENHRLHLFSSKGEPVGVIGSLGAQPGEFKLPFDIAIDQTCQGTWVTDRGNSRLQLLSFEGRSVRTLSLITSLPCGVAFDARLGSLYVVDTGKHCVQVFGNQPSHHPVLTLDQLLENAGISHLKAKLLEMGADINTIMVLTPEQLIQLGVPPLKATFAIQQLQRDS